MGDDSHLHMSIHAILMDIKAPETNNNILGYNWNPHNNFLSSGGSSGGWHWSFGLDYAANCDLGEGAMQALKGSAFGLGTDIG